MLFFAWDTLFGHSYVVRTTKHGLFVEALGGNKPYFD